MHGRAIFISIIMCMACLTLAEFRTWTDQSGNSIEAELITRMGDKIVIRDRKGRTHKIDPAKLSDEDQAYLNKPRYKLTFAKRSQRQFEEKTAGGMQEKVQTDSYLYVFTLRVVREDGKELDEGLIGQLFAYGGDVSDQSYVVIEKAVAPVQLIEKYGEVRGEIQGEGCTLLQRCDEKGEVVEGTKYKGYLVVLLSSEGEVLAKKCSNHFLNDHEKVMALNIGDRFNKQLVKTGNKK